MTILSLRVIPGSSRNLVKDEAGVLRVYLTKPPQEGKANKQLIDLLSRHLKVKKYQIKIIKGDKSRDKKVEIIS